MTLIKKASVKLQLSLKKPKYIKQASYKFSDDSKSRHKSLSKIIKSYNDIKVGALKKKKRLNVLRIFYRYSNPKYCKIITNDMKFIDKTFLKGKSKTSNICTT